MTVIGKEYCVWRLQMRYIADSSTSPYVLMLERWMLLLLYIQRSTVLLVRDIVYKDHKLVFSSWFKHEFICPDVRVLNATIFVHSTPNTTIGKKYYVWRLQVSYLVDLSTSLYVPMLERWRLPFSYIRRPSVLLARDIVNEDRKCVI